MQSAPVIEIDSYAVAVGMNESGSPACLILSCDGLAEGADLARASTNAFLTGDELRLLTPSGSLVLKRLAGAILEAAKLQIPLLVLDPALEHEHLVKISVAE